MIEHQWYWPNWYKLWPSTAYVEYNEDNHYGPVNFGKRYLCIGAFQCWWWTALRPNTLFRPRGWDKKVKEALLKEMESSKFFESSNKHRS